VAAYLHDDYWVESAQRFHLERQRRQEPFHRQRSADDPIDARDERKLAIAA